MKKFTAYEIQKGVGADRPVAPTEKEKKLTGCGKISF
jgi:hypothetical protein